MIFGLAGALAVMVARDYPMGSAARMGPGYFPTLLGGILALLGAFLVWRGIVSCERVKGEWGWRPLALVSAALVLFGLALPRFGLLPALAATLLAGALAGREFRVKEVLVLIVVMCAFAQLVFIELLNLPYPLIGWR